MPQTHTLLRGWRAILALPTNHFEARSRNMLLSPVSGNLACSKMVTPRMFGGSLFSTARPLGSRSFFLLASGGGGGGGSGGGKSSGGGGAGAGGGGGHYRKSSWSLWSWYLSLLATHPVKTKALSSAFLNLAGDLICQLAVDRVREVDVKRSFIFTLLGLVLVGPTLHFWYLSLSKMITVPGNSGAVLRLLLDQFVFSPIFLGIFLSALVTLEGKPSHVIPKLQQDWFPSVVANWQLWIPFQFINFRYVPQQFQVLASNFFALIWNVVLSYKAHKDVLVK